MWICFLIGPVLDPPMSILQGDDDIPLEKGDWVNIGKEEVRETGWVDIE